MFDRLSHIMFFAKDVGRACAWYRQKLGFDVVYQAGNEFARLQHSEMGVGISLHTAGDHGEMIGCGPISYFASCDFDHAISQMRMNGITVSEPRSEGGPRFASFRDSEGNVLGVQEAN